jgi:hypothetical protein
MWKLHPPHDEDDIVNRFQALSSSLCQNWAAAIERRGEGGVNSGGALTVDCLMESVGENESRTIHSMV